MSVEPSFFPSNKIQALAMVYLQNQDLSGKSPEQLTAIYLDAYEKVNIAFRKSREDSNFVKSHLK